MDDPTPLEIEKGRYRHAKSGQLYEVIGVALQTETSEQLIVYRPLYDSDYEIFARPYEMFTARVEIDGKSHLRFEKIDN